QRQSQCNQLLARRIWRAARIRGVRIGCRHSNLMMSRKKRNQRLNSHSLWYRTRLTPSALTGDTATLPPAAQSSADYPPAAADTSQTAYTRMADSPNG